MEADYDGRGADAHAVERGGAIDHNGEAEAFGEIVSSRIVDRRPERSDRHHGDNRARGLA